MKVAVGAAALLATAALAVGCGSAESAESRGKSAGEALGASLAAVVERREVLQAPYRCARLDRPVLPAVAKLPPRVAGRSLSRTERVVELGPRKGRRRLILGAVADARGAGPRTREVIAEVARAFADRHVEVVLSLGGMGEGDDELEAVLGALAEAGDWLVVAVPGDREAIPGHRRAVTALRERGLAVVDGSDVRVIASDGVAIATMPGVEAGEQLIAGSHGCTHTEGDARALAELLAGRDGVKVWAGYAAPRQRTAGASDLVAGVHAGERALTEALAASKARLVVHGQIDEAALGPATGTSEARGRLVLGTGALEAIPVDDWQASPIAGAALIATIEGNRISWRRVRRSVARQQR